MPGPPGPKCRKSLEKVVPGLSARSAKKVLKKSKQSRRSLSLSLALFRDFFDFFGTFLALRADRPGTSFSRLFRHFRPGGPGTPCNWSLQSQVKISCVKKLSFLEKVLVSPASLQKMKFLDSCKLVSGMHWTGLPDRSTDQIGKNALKMSKIGLRRGFGQFSDIFSTFCLRFFDIL